jgi:hypothetical protein
MPLAPITAIHVLERATDETIAVRETRRARRRARADARRAALSPEPRGVARRLRALAAAAGVRRAVLRP